MNQFEILEGMKLSKKLDIPSSAGEVVAQLMGEECNIPITEEILSKHVLYTGTIGTGKTTAIFQLLDQIIPKMNENDVMIIFDTKGDFEERYYREGFDTIISNDEKTTAFWNVFKEVMVDGEERTQENLLELVTSFFEEKITKSNAPFFPQAAKDVLYGIMTYIMRNNEPEDLHNEELYSYLTDANPDDVVEALDSIDTLRGIVDYIYNGGENSEQTQGVYSELRLVENEIFRGNFNKKGDFSVREFVRNKGGKVLFIEYDLGIGKVLTPVYRTMMDLAIKEALCRKKTEGNVFFVIDEFKLLPNLYHIDDGVNFGRAQGAKFIVAMQNIQQIIDGYGKERAYSILSAFGTNVSFCARDKATKEFIQNIYGQNRKKFTYDAASYSEGEKILLTYSNVVEDWEILGLKRGEAIVSVYDYGNGPVKMKFRKES